MRQQDNVVNLQLSEVLCLWFLLPTCSISRVSSYARCPDIAVHSRIKSITLFKLSRLLICSKSPMIIHYNNQKPFFMGLAARRLDAELTECVSSALQSAGTVALCPCYFLCIFQKIK